MKLAEHVKFETMILPKRTVNLELNTIHKKKESDQAYHFSAKCYRKVFEVRLERRRDLREPDWGFTVDGGWERGEWICE